MVRIWSSVARAKYCAVLKVRTAHTSQHMAHQLMRETSFVQRMKTAILYVVEMKTLFRQFCQPQYLLVFHIHNHFSFKASVCSLCSSRQGRAGKQSTTELHICIKCLNTKAINPTKTLWTGRLGTKNDHTVCLTIYNLIPWKHSVCHESPREVLHHNNEIVTGTEKAITQKNYLHLPSKNSHFTLMSLVDSFFFPFIC